MSDRKRIKNASTKLAIELKAGDQISLERDERGMPLKLVVKTAKLSPDGRYVEVTPRSGSTQIVEWKKEVDIYLPPKKDKRYALLFWIAKHLGAPIKRA